MIIGTTHLDALILFTVFLFFEKNIVEIEIVSYGFNNFFNDKYDIQKANIFGNTYEQEIQIDSNDYLLSIVNKEQHVNFDYINRTAIITSCIVRRNVILLEDINGIIQYFKRLLQFITVGSDTKIDLVTISYDDKTKVDLLINGFEANGERKEEQYHLCFSSFGEHKKQLFPFINNYFERSYNIFFKTASTFHESQIPAVIGEFESVFDKSVKNDAKYKRLINEKRESLHHKELMKIIKQFKSDNNIPDEAFGDFISLIKSYSLSLCQKIDYVFNEMTACLKLKPYDFGFIRTVVGFAERQSKVRTGIVHGKTRDEMETKKAVYTIEIFQELIYFMVFKYIFDCSANEIIDLFDCYYFKTINLECGLLKNDS